MKLKHIVNLNEPSDDAKSFSQRRKGSKGRKGK